MGGGTLRLLSRRLKAGHKGTAVNANSVGSPCVPLRGRVGLAKNTLRLVTGRHFPIRIVAGDDLIAHSTSMLRSVKHACTTIDFAVAATSSRVTHGLRPGTPMSSRHFGTVGVLSSQNVCAKITLVPILPFVGSSVRSVRRVMRGTTRTKTSCILPLFKMALEQNSHSCFCSEMRQVFPGVTGQCRACFRSHSRYVSPGTPCLGRIFCHEVRALKVDTAVGFCRSRKEGRLSLFWWMKS